MTVPFSGEIHTLFLKIASRMLLGPGIEGAPNTMGHEVPIQSELLILS